MNLAELRTMIETHPKTVGVLILPESEQQPDGEIWRLTYEVGAIEINQLVVFIYVKDEGTPEEQAWFKNYPNYLKKHADWSNRVKAEIARLEQANTDIIRIEIRGIDDSEEYAYLRIFLPDKDDPTMIDRHEYMVFGKGDQIVVKRLVGDAILH